MLRESGARGGIRAALKNTQNAPFEGTEEPLPWGSCKPPKSVTLLNPPSSCIYIAGLENGEAYVVELGGVLSG